MKRIPSEDDSSLLSEILKQEITDFPELFAVEAGAPMAREGVAPQETNMAQATVAAAVKEVTTVASTASGTVTIQYSHILLALAAFIVLAVGVVTIIRKRSRQKTGFRNRRGRGGGGPSILQDDSDEDDILISSMYSSS
ncbi:hypothetical protein CAEBREN_15862 [Caenorhabditis brenneri]|uniref:Uncharacterized protein n=1 Tax=Caenorhabditis brenneri TaxID=135651 RepID=G0NMG7_CAEBE|nr:hypothetical protein CAEBREN_15862 [Caenorhabditis brenneri]